MFRLSIGSVHGRSFGSEDADDCKDGFCGNDGEGSQLLRDAESYMITWIHNSGKTVNEGRR